MSRTIHHITSETSSVKATLEVHYSDLLPCSCHRQTMKALTWQRKHLNEVVHIFHCCLEAVPLQGFKFTAHTPQTALPVCKATLHTDFCLLDLLPLRQQTHLVHLDLRTSHFCCLFICQGIKMFDCLSVYHKKSLFFPLLFLTEIENLSLYHLKLQSPPSFLPSRPPKKTKTLACCVTTTQQIMQAC